MEAVGGVVDNVLWDVVVVVVVVPIPVPAPAIIQGQEARTAQGRNDLIIRIGTDVVKKTALLAGLL